jgi:hypothetical protein
MPPSLTQHVDALYPVARVVVGEAEAGRLVLATYQRAAAVPPDDRPADQRAWMLQLLMDTQADASWRADRPDADVEAPGDGTSSFRHEVARDTARRVLPVALAACSARERTILALDVADEILPADIGQVLGDRLDDMTADEALSNARSHLRAALRDSLTGPERMLVDTALPEAALRETLRTYLMQRYHPAPSTLRSDVAALIREARQERQSDEEERPPSERPPSPEQERHALNLRRAGLALGVLVFIGTVAFALSHILAPSPSPPSQQPMSLLQFSARHVQALSVVRQTPNPDTAEAVLQSAMNRRLTVPRIDGATLSGVSRLPIPNAGAVPALVYTDTASGATVSTFAYTYALIDALGPRTELDAELRRALTTPDSLITRTVDDRAAVLWRSSDDVYVAVSSLPSDALAARIRAGG